MKIILFIWLSLPLIALADMPECLTTDNLCQLQYDYKHSDRILNETYQLIINNIEADKFSDFLVNKDELKNSLVKSQRAWLKFLEANCQAFYVLSSGGAQRNEAQLECLTSMTNERIRYLKDTYL